MGPGKAAVNASNELNLTERTRNLDRKFIQVSYTLIPARFLTAAGNGSEHHTKVQLE